MARITIEDCIEQIPNRFDLTACAIYRAKQLKKGHSPKVEVKETVLANGIVRRENVTVTAFCEIAAEKVSIEMLKKISP